MPFGRELRLQAVRSYTINKTYGCETKDLKSNRSRNLVLMMKKLKIWRGHHTTIICLKGKIENESKAYANTATQETTSSDGTNIESY